MELAPLERIAIEAGRLIARIQQGDPEVRRKSDGSPVTGADEQAEELIVRALRKIDASIPIVAEEAVCSGAIDAAAESTFILVDALDGTKEFIAGRADYTVNICLVENGTPLLGVVVAPARGELFSGGGEVSYRCRLSPDGAIRERAQIRTSLPCEALAAVASSSHSNAETEAFLGRLPIGRKVAVGSSLKFCLVAAAEADIYPRFGRTMQWDTAAGDAVLRGAGGCTLTRSGEPLEYRIKGGALESFANPHFVSFGGTPEALRSLLDTAAPEPVAN